MSSNKKNTGKGKAEQAPEVAEEVTAPTEEERVKIIEEAVAAADPVNTVPVEAEAAWDVETWKSVSRLRIGVEPHAIVGALSKKDKTAVYTEREIRALVEAFLNTPAS